MFETVLVAHAGQAGEGRPFVARLERERENLLSYTCTGLTDAGQTLSTLRALLKVRRLAASSTPKRREDEATVFGGSCSERAEGSRFGLQLSFL